MAQTDETELKASWFDFAKRLHPVGMSIFSVSPIKLTEQRAADIRIIGLMLLVRTLSNLKAAIALDDPPDADGTPGIDVDPSVRDVEVIEMLNLICLAVIGVFLGVAELLEQDTTPTGTMAAEFKSLTERSGQMQGADEE